MAEKYVVVKESALLVAVDALSHARRLWPIGSSHPAASMIRGLREDCDSTFGVIGVAINEVASALTVDEQERARRELEYQEYPEMRKYEAEDDY